MHTEDVRTLLTLPPILILRLLASVCCVPEQTGAPALLSRAAGTRSLNRKCDLCVGARVSATRGRTASIGGRTGSHSASPACPLQVCIPLSPSQWSCIPHLGEAPSIRTSTVATLFVRPRRKAQQRPSKSGCALFPSGDTKCFRSAFSRALGGQGRSWTRALVCFQIGQLSCSSNGYHERTLSWTKRDVASK